MDDNTREVYETLFDLFTHPGWQILKADVAARKDSYVQQMLTGTNDPNQLLLLKGAIVEASMVVNAEENTKQNFDMAEAQATETEVE